MEGTEFTFESTTISSYCVSIFCVALNICIYKACSFCSAYSPVSVRCVAIYIISVSILCLIPLYMHTAICIPKTFDFRCFVEGCILSSRNLTDCISLSCSYCICSALLNLHICINEISFICYTDFNPLIACLVSFVNIILFCSVMFFPRNFYAV